LRRAGSQDNGSGLLRIRETERTLRQTWQAIFLFGVVTSLFGWHLSMATLLLSAGTIPSLLIGQAQMLHPLLQRIIPADRVLVYGDRQAAARIISALRNSPRRGLRPVAVVEDDLRDENGCILTMDYRLSEPVPVYAAPVTPDLLQSTNCGMLVIAASGLGSDRVEYAIAAARDAGLATALVYLPPSADHQNSIHLDDLALHTAKRDPSRLDAAAKRALDLIGSALLLVALAPLLLLVALLIRLDSPGPALFTQERVGRYGRVFKIYKFRSMYSGCAKYAPSPVSSADPRITRIGRLLRLTSLDELPQLLNVLLGDMSLVGPRPEMPFIVDQYGPTERRRLQVLPGITGLWQLSADRRRPIHENLEYDFYYIRHRTLLMDVAILIHTIIFAPSRGV
ncbi:MAG TPA: exopolysaccharide biosynthesis polyprenyl glycosylphosphotransferase, partial [Acidobacteriaceae bacterium]|nr:exopolysaccharide biosynthesis polyprenyl glycosylphosphotransferase [Acidobacteriaceae bacterium]